MEDLAECQEADGDDDDGDAVEELGHAEGEPGGAAGAVNADEGQGEADAQGRDAADHGFGDDGGDGEEGEHCQGEVLGRAEDGGHFHQGRGEEDHQGGGDEAADEGADGAGGQRLGGLPALGHAVALEGGGDGRGVARGVEQDSGGGVTEEAAEVDAGEHDERRGRLQRERDRQQQGHRHGGTESGKDADGGAEDGADQHPEEVDGGQGAGEAAHEEFELFH